MSEVTARNTRENASTLSTRGSSYCSPVARSRERNLGASGDARKGLPFPANFRGGLIMTRKRYLATRFAGKISTQGTYGHTARQSPWMFGCSIQFGGREIPGLR